MNPSYAELMIYCSGCRSEDGLDISDDNTSSAGSQPNQTSPYNEVGEIRWEELKSLLQGARHGTDEEGMVVLDVRQREEFIVGR